MDRIKAFFMPPEWIAQQLEKENKGVSKRQVHRNNSSTPIPYMMLNLAVAISSYTYLSSTFDAHSPLSWLIGIIILQTLYLLARLPMAIRPPKYWKSAEVYYYYILGFLLNNLILALE